MRRRVPILVAALALALLPAIGLAQQQTGTILGKVVDNSGAVLPGVTVTISGSPLLQPRILVTSETGTYRAPDLPIGTYSVKFELAGFRTLIRTEILLTIGFNAEVDAALEVSAIEETITVSGESPIVDTKSTTARTTFDIESLQSIPSARDPWVMLERTPAIAMDRANVGGSQSGQQSNYVSRGAFYGNNQWAIDGVNITDMSATGASPIYYDFDMLQEMQVTTGGADASQQTGGVGINLVTRSGTDKFRGSGRYYITDEEFQADNVNDELRAQGARSGNPIQNIEDYGVEVGGPIVKGSLWYWGSVGVQNIKVGVLGFYKNTPTCRPTPPTDTDGLRACLETDLTELNNYNWKLNWAPFTGNKLGFQNTWAEKVRNARDASDTRPLETTYRQKAVSSRYGATGWITGPSPLWKASDQHVFGDRLLMEVQWAHLGNNFVLDFHEDSLYDVQATYEITTGVWGRSYQSAVYLRPTNSLDFTTNYFLPNTLGGDHAFKAGVRWRSAQGFYEGHRGGNTIARFRNGVASEAYLYRDALQDYLLNTWALYVQDTYTVKRFTLNLGLRFDSQGDELREAAVPGHPFAPQWLPAVTFPGADSGVTYNNWSPRLGATYDVRGNGKTIAKASYSIYFGQLNPGGQSGPLNPVTEALIGFPWTDTNGDTFVQGNEVDYTRILTFGGNYNPDNPTALTTVGSVDPDLDNDRTLEFIVGIDHEVLPGFGVGASYIWRKYDQIWWDDRLNFGSSNYVARTFTPAASACPVAGSRCETVTYYEPTVPIPSPYIRTVRPDYYRDYNGFELTAQKRYSNRWMMAASYAYNNGKQYYDSPASYEDPTNIEFYDNAQYAPESTTSGIDNVFINATWLFKLNGMYTLPWWDINLAANYGATEGYPFQQAVRTPTRANRAGTADVLLDAVGDNRLPTVQKVDFRVDKAFTFGTMRIIPSMDIFNLTNVNTVLAQRRLQNASNANYISAIVSPRVIRFGVRVTW